MITTREEFLAAVRRADLTPQGIVIGPLAFVDGRSIRLNVTDETARRLLITKAKLAASKYFSQETIWGIPCSEPISSSSPSGTSTRQEGPPF